MNKSQRWLYGAVLLAGIGGLYYVLGGPMDREMAQKRTRADKIYKARSDQEKATLQSARHEVIALSLDDGTKNYYLHRLDEQARGYFGGADGAKDTVAEARERSKR